jgi:hypothetical protein
LGDEADEGREKFNSRVSVGTDYFFLSSSIPSKGYSTLLHEILGEFRLNFTFFFT